MTPAEKLRAYMDSLPRGEITEYGETLRTKYHRKSGPQLLIKWAKSEGFSPANQRLAAEIFGLPTDYFADDRADSAPDSEPSPVNGRIIRYRSLREFLDWRESPFPALQDDEIAWLASHEFADGDPGTLAWWSTMLQAYRGLMAAHRPNQPRPARPLAAPVRPTPSSGPRRR